MQTEQIYAIVDIEATGGSVGADEKIIQFACVLIQNGETIHTFETFVNPGKNIPRKIRKLTGITNKDVKDAPYFEEIAPMILTLLEDAVFVAHNVGFDYRFLNEQLKSHGIVQLDIPAVDTVELTQILYPAMDSFQLEDIAGFLNYDLNDAHDALADAEATVHIFKQLFKRAAKFPLVTLEKLNTLAACTTHETSLFFKAALETARIDVEPLADDLIVVNQIAMKNPEDATQEPIAQYEALKYPETKSEKERYFNTEYEYREVQSDMMDLVHNYLDGELSLEKLTIEAPPGIGKSLGYLFPAVHHASSDQPMIVSTYTTLLQDQLLEETLPALEKMLNREIPTTLVKSRNHYLSLSIFERWLNKIEADDSEAYLCMRILVWLTETKTGDLSEINAGSHLDLTFWQEIRVTNHQHIDDHWERYDFYERIKQSVSEAEVIITNHNFLVYDWQSSQPVLSNIEQLIVDEAHHFPDVAVKASTQTIHGIDILTQLEKVGSATENTGIFQLVNVLEKQGTIQAYDLLTLKRNTQLIVDSWDSLFEHELDYFEKKELTPRQDSNFVEREFKLNALNIKQKKVIKNILRGLEEFTHITQKIAKAATPKFKQLSSEHQLLLIELGKLSTYMNNWKQEFQNVFTFDDTAPQTMRWVTFIPEHMENSFQFHVLKWGASNSLIDYLATHSKVVFTSSTMSFKNSEQYFSGQLKDLPMQFHRLKSPFDYGKQVRVMVPEKRANPKNIRKNKYPYLLAEDIAKILKNTKVNTIVLFRSLEVLENVYHILMDDRELSDHVLLAQSITGTRNRILKNFKRHHPAVILGADSFFEGIDLPDQELELVILTRLPFPAPNTPMMRLKTDDLKQKDLNPFIGEYLPQAVLKFKQAFGRLIRKESDNGVLVVLDDRFLNANYSKVFKQSLPKGVPIEIYDNNQLGYKIQAFLDKKL